jgi:demethylmenaquinone methyltransferase/2-methoxy-6-polyprenyl-1,4-benzoquinol methylase
MPDHARRPTGSSSPAVAKSGNPVPEPAVTAMFDAIAPAYDRMNSLMTLGRDGAWRRAARDAAGLRTGDAAIDVACGTGKLAALLAETVGPFGRVEAVDLSEGMIARGRRVYRDLVQLHFRVANALALPYADGEFDAATIAFGLRNLADYEAGFREMARVVRPGGTVVCLELSLPRWRTYARLYHALFRRVAPLAGAIVARQGGAYRYLPDSLDAFPSAEQLAATMRAAGLVDVAYRRLTTGVVALHRGRVPPRG